MKIHLNVRHLVAIAALGAVLAAPTAALAQRPGRISHVRPSWHIRDRIDRAERLSNRLRATFERDYDRYDLGRLNRGDNAKQRIQRLDEAFEDLRKEADDRRPRQGRDEMRRVLTRAEDVEELFRRHPEIARFVRQQWWDLRTEIQSLARTFDLPPLVRSR